MRRPALQLRRAHHRCRQGRTVSVSQTLNDADAGKIQDVTIDGSNLTGHYKDRKETFHTVIPANFPDLYKNLREHGVNITIKDQTQSLWLSALVSFLPVALILAFSCS